MPAVTAEGAGGALLPAFYAGREVLITGGSGFLGKVLIERLLWTCPEVGAVHLLLRDKRGLAPQQRLAQLKHSQAFDNIRAQCPWQLDKLRVVSGDVAQPDLGLEPDALLQLHEVSVVFHNAATVKFWESLRTALHQNVTSVLAVMDLCDQLPKLEVLVHVSTAYSNAEQRRVEERVYAWSARAAPLRDAPLHAAPLRATPLRAALLALPPALLDPLTDKLIAPKPNTYVFSKAMAESMIEERAGRRYAAAIVRPSIVVSSHRHPYPGWIENLAGPSGAVVGCAKGLLHAFNLDPRARADLIPVDITIDTMLAVAWEAATERGQAVRVYNSCSQENPITWGHFRASTLRSSRAHPLHSTLYYPFTFGVKNRFIFKSLELLLQTAPLYIANYIAKACGVNMQVSLVTASERLQAMTSVLAFFATREWEFGTDNVRRLRARLTPRDRQIYNLDVRDVNWDQHVFEFVCGARKYLLRERDDTLPTAKRHLARLRFVHHLMLLLITILVCNFIMYLIPKFVFKRMALLRM